MAASGPPKLFGTTIDQLTSRTVFRWTRKQSTAFVDFGQLHGFEKKAEIAAADLQPLFAALGLAYLNGERNHLDQDISKEILRPKVIDKMARLMKEGHWRPKDEQTATVQVKEEDGVAGQFRASTSDQHTVTGIIPDSDRTEVISRFIHNRKIKNEPVSGEGGIMRGPQSHGKDIKAPLGTRNVFTSDSEDTEPNIVAKTRKIAKVFSDVGGSATNATRRGTRGIMSFATRKVFISDSDPEHTDREDTTFDALTKAFSASNVGEISPTQSEDINCVNQYNYVHSDSNQRDATVVPTNGLLTPLKSPLIYKPRVKLPTNSNSTRLDGSSDFSNHHLHPGNSTALSQIASLKDITLELWHRLMKLEEMVKEVGEDSSEFIL